MHIVRECYTFRLNRSDELRNFDIKSLSLDVSLRNRSRSRLIVVIIVIKRRIKIVSAIEYTAVCFVKSAG